MDEFHYEEVALSDMVVEDNVLLYPCPCGDLFELDMDEFIAGANVAQCPTCSLTVRIIASAEERARFIAAFNGGSAPPPAEALTA